MAQLQHSTATNPAEALDGAFKQIRILHAVFLASIPLFAYSGEAARYLCFPRANLGQPPRQNFVIQLEEARADWKRRYPR
jgi:hypothetical protein